MDSKELPEEGDEVFEEAVVEEEEVEYEEVEEEEEEIVEQEVEVNEGGGFEGEGVKVSTPPSPHGTDPHAPNVAADTNEPPSQSVGSPEKSESTTIPVVKVSETAPSPAPQSYPSGTEIDLKSIEAQASKARRATKCKSEFFDIHMDLI